MNKRLLHNIESESSFVNYKLPDTNSDLNQILNPESGDFSKENPSIDLFDIKSLYLAIYIFRSTTPKVLFTHVELDTESLFINLIAFLKSDKQAKEHQKLVERGLGGKQVNGLLSGLIKEEVVNDVYEYLNVLGIDAELFSLVQEWTVFNEQRIYKEWMKDCREFYCLGKQE